MIIQELMFQDDNICSIPEMYFRKDIDGSVSMETYFNSFSIGKWKKYTVVDNLSIHVCLNSKARFKAYSAIGHCENPETYNTFFTARSGNSLAEAGVTVERREIPVAIKNETITSEQAEYDIVFEELPNDGIVYLNICGESIDSEIRVLSGYYYTDCKCVNESIKLAVGICTFKREEFLSQNLEMIRTKIFDNESSPLNGKMEIFVADNGNSILDETNEKFNRALLNDSRIHVYPNKNAGGASGFTRTMIEALLRDNNDFSHIILMDDDIVLSEKVLERTYNFLCFVRPEYRNAMVGAEMFKLDERSILFESGAECRGMTSGFFHKMWDMRIEDAVSANEEETPVNYSGWWYNVVPANIVEDDNLPMPLFIHYDDIEYGMRNSLKGNETILLNGICVWHPQGIGKAPVQMKYYDVRNVMISMVDTPYEVSAKQIKWNLFKRVIGAAVRYRYNDADAALQAVANFYAGPEYFDSIDPEQYHMELRRFNYSQLTPEEAQVDASTVHKKIRKHSHAYLVLSVLCWFLPSMNVTRVVDLYDIGLPFTARRLFHFDAESGKGILVERNRKEARRLWREYRSICRTIDSRHDEVTKQWREHKKVMVTKEYWEKYLGI